MAELVACLGIIQVLLEPRAKRDALVGRLNPFWRLASAVVSLAATSAREGP
jgi:hypothetical protein